jgi:transcription termination/antitermination protein NusG
MKRNWYAVYTKPQQEKKVASILSKRGIQNYYPVNKVAGKSPSSKKMVMEPLFSSLVFVHSTETELLSLKKIPGVVNVIYWISKPAVIQNEEITAVQQFTSVYQNIKLEKCAVNITDMIRITDDPIISFKENAATIRFQTIKIKLPSLGYTMIAQREKVINERIPEVTHPVSFIKQLDSFLSN